MSTRYFMCMQPSGLPYTGALPTFVKYVNANTGAARTAPSVPIHVGSGLFAWTSSDEDEDVGTVALIDAGSVALPRYHTFAIHKIDNTNQFWAVHLEAAAGTLWTGSAPTIASYRDPVGGSVTPQPTMNTLATYLYSFVPTTLQDAGIWIEFPVGCSSLGYSGQTSAVVETTPEVPINYSVPATSTQNTYSISDFHWNTNTGLPVLVNHDIEMLSENEALAQRLWLRLTRIRGENTLDLDSGLRWFDYGNKPANLSLIRQEISAECRDVVGVVKVLNCDLTLGKDRHLSVTLKVQGKDGAISLSI